MENLIGQYVETIAIPFVIAIVALAFPLMLDASSKISNQYKSSIIAKSFQKEFAYRVFVVALLVSVSSIVLYVFKLPVIEALSNCWVISNSAVLLVYSSTLLLVITLLVLAYIISIYYRQDKLIKHLSRRYNWKARWFNKHDKDDFLAISKLMNYSIDNADEDLAREVFGFFFGAFIKYRKMKDGQEVVYPEEFYNSVFEASEQLCMRQRKTVSYYNDGTLYDFFIDSYQQTKVSQKTLRFMWMCVIQNMAYNKDEYVFSLWKKIFQHVSLFLTNNRTLAKENGKYIEFARVVCAYVLSKEKYELLLKLLRFSQMSPAQYSLTPSSTQEVIAGCKEVLKHNKYDSLHFPVYWESIYPWPGVDGADAETIIEGKLIDCLAVLFLWQYILPKTFMSHGYSDAINHGDSLEEKKETLEALTRLQISVKTVLDNKQLLSVLGCDRLSYDVPGYGHKSPKSWFEDNIMAITGRIEVQEDAEERNARIPQEIIQKYNETVVRTSSALFINNTQYQSQANKRKKTEKYDLLLRRDISRKSHIIRSINYAETVGGFLATDYSANMWMPLLRMKVHRYVLKEEDVLKVILDFNNRKGLVIFNFGIWINEKKYLDEGLLKKKDDKLYTKSGIEIIYADTYLLHPVLVNSMMIIKQNDLPAVEFNKADKSIIDELQLQICEREHNVYTSVIDFNEANEDLRNKYLAGKQGEEDKYAMFISYVNSSLCYNPDSKVLLLSVYNQFADRMAPQNPTEVKDIWKKGN